jgi:hypothetical protein
MNRPLLELAVVEDTNDANTPRVDVPVFRTANSPRFEFKAVEDEVMSRIVPPVKLLAVIFHPV